MMPDTVSIMAATTSLLLPWALGCVWVYALLRTTGRWNGLLIAGHGYLVGMFLTTLVIRLSNTAGMPLHYWSIAGIVAGLAMIGLLTIRLHTAPARETIKSPPLKLWQWAVTALLLALILLRYSTIAQELMLRPLFPWDAWMNWAPKAVVWFHYEDMVAFVSPKDWLTAPASALYHTEGAGKAWQYPVTVPLIQLWEMLGLGSVDNTLTYLPWLIVALALGMALYGHLRLSGATRPVAMLGAYALLNLPFINVHVALAGYADIWVTAAFGCAVFALHEWSENRQWPYALLALFLAIVCTQLKIPGLLMGGIVLLVLLTSIVKPGKKLGIALLVVSTLCVIYAAAFGINLSVPGIGQVSLAADGIVLPYIGQYDLQYHPVHGAMLNTLFLMLNWNMLWYLLTLLVLITIFKATNSNSPVWVPSLELRALLLTLAFIFFVYYFTNRYEFLLDYTQVNRALIYSTPIMVYYLFNCIQRWLAPGDRGSRV